MGKLGVGVGDEFPVDEPAASTEPSSDTIDADRAAREEWRRRRDEWRAQRRAWKAEWRARRNAFRADVRRSVHTNFGPGSFSEHNGWVVRVLIGIGLVALAIAVLPFLFLLGVFVAIGAMAVSRHGFFHHHGHEYGAAGRGSDRTQ